MRNTAFRIFTIFLIGGSITAQNKPGGNTKPVGDLKTSAKYEYVLNDPLKARIYTLNNGLKVYLSVYKNAPRIQTFIAVNAGSKNDPPTSTGLAHYLEHMVFKGTDVFGTKDWKKESAELKKIEDLYEEYRNTKDEKQRKIIYHRIDSISGAASKYSIANEYDKMLAAIGADGTNAFTSFDQTVYVNDIPSNQVESWLKIESERFKKLVLRLFHTELEAVYEEKNRCLDSDNDKIFTGILSGLFQKHTYGTQTTIGTIDHLKNPSMVEINKFFNKYYVPNNMAIIMSGDFDPDKVIVDIEKYFGGFKAKPVEAFKYEPENTITSKIIKEIVGPDPANVNMAWRLDGSGSRDDDMGEIVALLLYNNRAGLMDINLNQAQKILKSESLFEPLKDYSLFGLSGEPKEGQSLEEVEKLLMSQINLLKKGEFPDWLMQAVITDLKLRKTKDLESNTSRAGEMLSAFTNELKWQNECERLERISKITRQEIIDFTNKKFLETNYVVAYKRTGQDNSVQKVEKPAITPVEVDRENASPFVKNIMNAVPKSIEPKFVDYQKDIIKFTTKNGIPVLYNKNTENKLFELYYKFDMGKNNDKVLPVAIKYIPFISTKDMTAAIIKQELYKLGCSFNVFCDNENTWISLTGLNENFDKAFQLFEKILANPIVDEKVLKNLVSDLIKERNDNKLKKNVILNMAMVNYARYGQINPFSNVLSDEDLNKLTPDIISSKIKQLSNYRHNILYYGPKETGELKTFVEAYHTAASPMIDVPRGVIPFEEKNLTKNVFVVDYDMTQAEIIMLTNGESYDRAMVPVISLYNSYFGGGMSGVVFQDLRESKALAYSCFSRYNLPDKLTKKSFNLSYIGSQADKLGDALKGMKDLLEVVPKADNSFAAAKEAVLQEIRSQRITKSEVIFNYLAAEQLGNKIDIRKEIFGKIKNYTFEDIKKFHEQNIKGKPTTLLVLGKKEALDIKTLEKYGTIAFLSLNDIFGY
jgi:predicted Zn-dependent peptidase